MIPCAYLRVYRPLEGFSESERARWERFIVDGGHPGPVRPIYREESLARGGSVGLLAPAEGDHAEVRLVDGRYYVCPWRTRLRVLASILSLRESAPAEMAQVFVPEPEARRAARELARMKRREPSAIPSILQSAWHVPIRWFTLVDDEERRLVEASDGGYRLFYLTPIARARRRGEHALQALRRTELDGVAHLVKDLVQWLASFGPHSLVELDYASVSEMFGWDELDDDHSGHDIQAAIGALGEPEGVLRGLELYQSVASRWAEARARESLN